jgi:two-component system CheB/CheR fusion protein
MDILSAEGHSVEIATGGKDAIQLLSGHKFDVIISDIAMPGVDGWDVISAAKELPDPVKTILISGLGDAFDGKRCRKEGVDLYLSKPVALDALLSALAKLFG